MNKEVVETPEYTDTDGEEYLARTKLPAVMLAEHLDVLLRDPHQIAERDVILTEIKKCLALFTHLREKEVCIACHERHLNDRRSAAYFNNSRLAYMDPNPNCFNEQQTIEWIRDVTGAELVSNLEALVHDMFPERDKPGSDSPKDIRGHILLSEMHQAFEEAMAKTRAQWRREAMWVSMSRRLYDEAVYEAVDWQNERTIGSCDGFQEVVVTKRVILDTVVSLNKEHDKLSQQLEQPTASAESKEFPEETNVAAEEPAAAQKELETSEEEMQIFVKTFLKRHHHSFFSRNQRRHHSAG